MKTLLILLDKEFRQLFRNSFLPKLVLVFPLVSMLVLPWVTTMDVRHINVAVVDQDRSSASRRLVQKIGASDYFTLVMVSDRYHESLAQLEAGKVDVIVEVPDQFEASLVDGTPDKMRVTTNGVNAMKGGLGAQYTVQTILQTLSELIVENGKSAPADAFVVECRYNPTLEYRHYMIPALMVMLLTLICGFLPALNVVSEKEVGTIEQINVTPVPKFVFILAKLLPYWLIGFLVLTVCFILAWLIYGIVPVGHFLLIYFFAVLFVLVMSGFGLVISNYSATMQQSMFVMWFCLLVVILMSGLFTPISSMPEWAQIITIFNPLKYFMEVMRMIYLKGSGFFDLLPQFGILLLFAVVFNSWAVISYRKNN